ncbi:MAG: methylenetetrahydrofolate reductase [NAD(P)H] [Candidatus Omnitrophica bacterium]|nr:methylenetetrahydrofolate reductase [NAD(P)H] [Candidatus Omnitrophota bacterium]
MKKLTEIFKSQKTTISFEIFPPKTEKGMESLGGALDELALLKPDFVSVTYGAGGSNRDTTLGLVRLVGEKYGLTAMHHFTCVIHTKNEIKVILDKIKGLGICNILALRGDPPKDRPDWKPGLENFQYSCELVQFIRENYGDFFAIGVAGFPEGHPLATSREFDAQILKKKIDAGGEFVVTQLFFDNKDYFDYVKRLKSQGVSVRVIPGVLPITNYEGAVNFCKGCGASVPQKIHDIFKPIRDDKEKTLEAGTQWAIRQCRELLKGGAPGLHLYTLNKAEPVKTIIKALAYP